MKAELPRALREGSPSLGKSCAKNLLHIQWKLCDIIEP
jgi:hypothetical protein